MRNYFFDFIVVCGLGLIVYGTSLVYVPAGFILGGVSLIGIASVLYSKGT